jgi:hypothetical protein
MSVGAKSLYCLVCHSRTSVKRAVVEHRPVRPHRFSHHAKYESLHFGVTPLAAGSCTATMHRRCAARASVQIAVEINVCRVIITRGALFQRIVRNPQRRGSSAPNVGLETTPVREDRISSRTRRQSGWCWANVELTQFSRIIQALTMHRSVYQIFAAVGWCGQQVQTNCTRSDIRIDISSLVLSFASA